MRVYNFTKENVIMGKRMKNPGFWMLLLGNVFSIIGCYLPFAKVFFVSIAYIEGDGMIVLAANVVGIFLAFVLPRFAFAANILALIVTAVGFTEIADLSFKLLGAGAYLIIIANVVAFIGSFVYKKK